MKIIEGTTVEKCEDCPFYCFEDGTHICTETGLVVFSHTISNMCNYPDVESE
jgi:hypothetical protein